MKTFFVRLVVDGNLSELGMVAAHDEGDLFTILDEFTNPYAYEFCNARAGDAVFYPARWGEDEESGAIDRDYAYGDEDATRCEPYLSEETIEQKKRRRWRRFTSHDLQTIDERHARYVVDTSPCESVN